MSISCFSQHSTTRTTQSGFVSVFLIISTRRTRRQYIVVVLNFSINMARSRPRNNWYILSPPVKCSSTRATCMCAHMAVIGYKYPYVASYGTHATVSSVHASIDTSPGLMRFTGGASTNEEGFPSGSDRSTPLTDSSIIPD